LTQGYGSGNTGKTVERLAETATPQKRRARPIKSRARCSDFFFIRYRFAVLTFG